MKLGADVNAADCYEETALMRGAGYNNIVLVQLLLNHGAALHSTDDQGQTALCKAVHHGHIFMMDMLMKRGLSVTALDDRGNTMLMEAVDWKQTAAVERLIHQGVAANAVNKRGGTALHIASSNTSCDDAAMIELLVANALHSAAKHGNIECAKVLIAAGSYVNNINMGGVSSLHVTITQKQTAVDHCSTMVQQQC
eukprot:11495-Heterococcus_DN1.PRE.2